MGKRIDLTGQVFGRWTVVQFSHQKQGSHWHCLCECGVCRIVRANSLKSGQSKSCGCRKRELATHHNMSGTPEHNIWTCMLQRCSNPKASNYNNYGGRGISVCPEWSSFEQFYADMGPRPSPKHSIDRKDNSGNYCKENCRWATRKEQHNNQRSNRLITYNGETRTLSQWADHSGVPRHVLHGRLRRGWSMDRAITEIVTRNKQ